MRDKGQTRRFKGQREKEALVKGLLLSFRDSLKVEKPPFSEFVRQCEYRLAAQRKARMLAARRGTLSLRWGLVLACVLVLGFLVGRGVFFVSSSEDSVAKQMGRVKVEEGARLHASRYTREGIEIIHFVLESGEATFEPEKLPGNVRYVVETPHLYIRVVGTVFHVRVVAEETLVKVDEGKVWCYLRSEGYTLGKVVDAISPPPGQVVLVQGEQHVWRSKPDEKLVRKEGVSSNTQVSKKVSSSEEKRELFSVGMAGGEVVSYQENRGYRVRLSSSQRLEIVPIAEGKEVAIDLSGWARQWFSPVLLEDSVVVVSYTGIILRFRYDGKILFKLRPVDGRVIGEPVVTTRGVVLMQSHGLTVCLWEGNFWTLPAEASFLVKSRPYYNERWDVLLYANEAGSIAGYSIGKREILWTHRLVREFVGAPIVGREEIAYLYGGTGNTLIAVDVRDGHFVWSVSLEAPLQKMDMIGENLVLLLDSSGKSEIRLYAPREGVMRMRFSLAGRIKDTLKDKGVWYLLTEEGEVYRLAPDEERLHFVTTIREPKRFTFVNNRVAVVGAVGVTIIEK
ncbi:MAG: PQQ-binding-like beta-propeller repeat protein [Brevinematales bacterium]|nr:PQQ-binding-like beta-propeller repeat protein [Brevinematales bacterium]